MTLCVFLKFLDNSEALLYTQYVYSVFLVVLELLQTISVNIISSSSLILISPSYPY